MHTHMKLAAALVLFALGMAGCGNSVGGPCSSNSNCPATQFDGGTVQAVCLLGPSTPGGYCALPCTTAGTQDDCPAQSFCTALTLGNYCAHICQTQSDCRSGYNCNGVTASSPKTCQ